MEQTYIIIVLYIGIQWVCGCNCQELDWENRRPKLCVSDPTYTKPSKNGEPIDVFLEVMILDIYDISEERMEFGMQIYLLTKWHDEFFNVTKLQINRPLTIPKYISQCLWVPDVIFLNCKQADLIESTIPNTVLKLLPSGKVYQYSRYTLTINCPMDFKRYPMDKQQCELRLGLLYSRSNDAELKWMDEATDSVKFPSIVDRSRNHDQQFKMHNPIAEKEVIVWQSGNSTELVCKLIFERYVTSSLINTYIPSLLVVCLSFVSFWLDVDSVPGRVTLGVTSLLTLSTQVVSARGALPPINYMTALDAWLFGCLLLVFLSLVEFTLANSLERKRKEKDKITPVSAFTKSTKPKIGNENEVCNKVRVSANNIKKFKLTLDIDKISRVIFPFIMILFISFYWSFFVSASQ